MSVRPWQAAVVAVGLLVGGGLLVYNMSGGTPTWKRESLLLDVTTGQVFRADTGKQAVIIPATNPQTGKRTLFPISQDEQGKWVVKGHYLKSLKDVGEKPTAIDERGMVLGEVKDIQNLR